MWVDEHWVPTESEVEAPMCAVFSVDQPEKLDIRKCPCHTGCIFAKPPMAPRPLGKARGGTMTPA